MASSIGLATGIISIIMIGSLVCSLFIARAIKRRAFRWSAVAMVTGIAAFLSATASVGVLYQAGMFPAQIFGLAALALFVFSIGAFAYGFYGYLLRKKIPQRNPNAPDARDVR
jgi:hypothetical protein